MHEGKREFPKKKRKEKKRKQKKKKKQTLPTPAPSRLVLPARKFKQRSV